MEKEIDFKYISNMEKFYLVLRKELELPEHFGDNLDALRDVISGDIELPLTLNFVDLTLGQFERFEDLIEMLEDLTLEVEGFEFACFMQDVDSM